MKVSRTQIAIDFPNLAMPVATQTIEAEPYLVPNAKLPASHVYPIEETNESFVLSPSRQFAFEQRPIPKLRTSRDVRVRIIATGLCGSDVRCTHVSDIPPTNRVNFVDSLLATRSHWQICRERPNRTRPRIRRYHRSMWRRRQGPPGRRSSSSRARCRLQHVRSMSERPI